MHVKGWASHSLLYLVELPNTHLEILFGEDVKSFCPASEQPAYRVIPWHETQYQHSFLNQYMRWRSRSKLVYWDDFQRPMQKKVNVISGLSRLLSRMRLDRRTDHCPQRDALLLNPPAALSFLTTSHLKHHPLCICLFPFRETRQFKRLLKDVIPSRFPRWQRTKK